MKINANQKSYSEINNIIKSATEDIEIDDCDGQRFIGAGSKGKNIVIKGISGNALGAYLNGSEITTFANAQDAVGDTMNEGKIVIHGSVGDAVGYAMRGGEIYIKGNAGYRAGIHMKEYNDKKPVIVIGGSVGSFLGEYQAGGLIIVLGLNTDEEIVGDFCGTGMHGGKMLIRTKHPPKGLPEQVKCEIASKEDIQNSKKFIKEFCTLFGFDYNKIMDDTFYVFEPNSASPYKRLYVAN